MLVILFFAAIAFCVAMIQPAYSRLPIKIR
jgi:hypothetical protein